MPAARPLISLSRVISSGRPIKSTLIPPAVLMWVDWPVSERARERDTPTSRPRTPLFVFARCQLSPIYTPARVYIAIFTLLRLHFGVYLFSRLRAAGARPLFCALDSARGRSRLSYSRDSIWRPRVSASAAVGAEVNWWFSRECFFWGGEAINEPWAILIAADAFIFQRKLYVE